MSTGVPGTGVIANRGYHGFSNRGYSQPGLEQLPGLELYWGYSVTATGCNILYEITGVAAYLNDMSLLNV